MNRTVLACLIAALVGVLAVVAGVFVVFGYGWALIVGGGLLAASSALLINVDAEERDGESSPAPP